MAHKFIHKFFNSYRFLALTLSSTLVSLLILNSFLFIVFSVRDHFRQDPVTIKYNHSSIRSVYPRMSESQISTLLKETWSRPYIYEPFTQFRERPFKGSYVNVDTNGFRESKNQGIWPPQQGILNIFLFGGSTMFGYGVADDQTVASYLQTAMMTMLNREVRVYNFGRGYFYSTQERILFENILASGITPNVAIFVNGLNDFYYYLDEPLYTQILRTFINEPLVSAAYKFFLRTPLGRAAIEINNGLENERIEDKLNATNHYADHKILDTVIQRYLQNKKLIEAVSKSFEVVPIFVWQPVPTYHYNQKYHLFSGGSYGGHTYSKYGYERMAEFIQEHSLGDNFLWLADIQKNMSEPLYVDKVHYSESFSKIIAFEIANMIINRSLVVQKEQIK